MKKITSILVKFSAIYLWAVGVFYIVRMQLYPDDKFGPMPWWFAVLEIIIIAIPAIALFLVPHSAHYKIVHKIIIAFVMAPTLKVFAANVYDSYLRVYQSRYVNGTFEIFTLSLGFLTFLLGYIKLFSKNQAGMKD